MDSKVSSMKENLSLLITRFELDQVAFIHATSMSWIV